MPASFTYNTPLSNWYLSNSISYNNNNNNNNICISTCQNVIKQQRKKLNFKCKPHHTQHSPLTIHTPTTIAENVSKIIFFFNFRFLMVSLFSLSALPPVTLTVQNFDLIVFSVIVNIVSHCWLLLLLFAIVPEKS